MHRINMIDEGLDEGPDEGLHENLDEGLILMIALMTALMRDRGAWVVEGKVWFPFQVQVPVQYIML